MLTRLRIKGFKNLVDVDLRFGPFTCIAGRNAVGKSNLFDAITFLSSTADMPLLEAAMSVRDRADRSTDIRSLFSAGKGRRAASMFFSAEMIVPKEGVDDLGQAARASSTFLTYELELGLNEPSKGALKPRLVVLKEALSYIKVSEHREHLPFDASKEWRSSVLMGKRNIPFISWKDAEGEVTILLHQEGGPGRQRQLKASTLPRTVLSSVNAIESPTALLARREMQSWRLLQLEPSSLRASDSFEAPSHLDSNGRHLAATLYRLAQGARQEQAKGEDQAAYSELSDTLAHFVEDVRRVEVDRDEQRELLTVVVETRDGTQHPARSLSDGTLRVMALAVLELDPTARGVLCLEEPENGVHPDRVGAMLGLLERLSVDTSKAVSGANPLRQVIINTHSPTVVAQVPEDSLVLAERAVVNQDGIPFTSVVFRPLSGTWRAASRPGLAPAQKAEVLSFLDPTRATRFAHDAAQLRVTKGRQVFQRKDLHTLSLWGEAPTVADKK